ncbi:MAG TPA: Ni,Fe-hydrogenase III large subunit [Gammaproteobacteria bacterium]|nr:Ni,Fe-hydrogenase III large subunit [Gammaproteobacteria bacterium]
MSRFDWLSEYLARMQDEMILVRRGSARELAPAHLLEIDAEDWGRAAQLAASLDYRWAGTWGDHRGEQIVLFACLENEGDYLVLRTVVDTATPVLPSHSPWYPAADRPERHLQDLLGVLFSDHLDDRRWTRHQAWSEASYPLRQDYPLAGQPQDETPPDGDYPFTRVLGSGVYEIPVGPVHAGIIEPGHFRFSAVGEEVLRLEQHLGYVHKGIEKLAQGRDPAGLLRLAARVSGDSTVAHSWAACQALERACGCRVPERAQALRGLLCERERVANHLGDIGAICNDVGFAFAIYQCSRLRELWQRRSAELFGHRFMMDLLVPGGIGVDLDQGAIDTLRHDHARLRRESADLFALLDDQPSLEDRLLNTGRLTAETARRFGCSGYVGKASGQAFDVRSANPYAPYDRTPMETPVLEEGDVMARLQIRAREIDASLEWMDRLLQSLPEGPLQADFRCAAAAEGIGFVEGWRGEIITYVRLDEDGRVARFFPRDPSWHSWPALERIVLGNIVPDFPVCNKSVNGSYSGHDL